MNFIHKINPQLKIWYRGDTSLFSHLVSGRYQFAQNWYRGELRSTKYYKIKSTKHVDMWISPKNGLIAHTHKLKSQIYFFRRKLNEFFLANTSS